MRRATRRTLIQFSAILLICLLLASVYFSGILEPRLTEIIPVLPQNAHAQPAKTRVNNTALNVLPSHLDFDLNDCTWENERCFITLKDGRKIRTSLIQPLQNAITKQLAGRKVPHGGVVLLEPHTGRVLAMVGMSHQRPAIKRFALRAKAPSASVFKLITAAALLTQNSIDVEAKTCYAGGRSYLSDANVRGDNAASSGKCATLGEAIARSINPVMARLAYNHLTKEDLEKITLKFGFNREIPFVFPVDVSVAEFSDDPIERAKTAAGFWHVNLSPLHAAMIAGAIANGGIMMRPSLIDEITDKSGNVIYRMTPKPWLTSMPTQKARLLSELAEKTTTQGSATSTFRGRKDWPADFRVSGKTGTLSNKRPYQLYTWFAGWGPTQKPRIAVGALIVNTEKWWIKGTHAAANAMLAWYKYQKQNKAK